LETEVKKIRLRKNGLTSLVTGCAFKSSLVDWN